MDITTQVHEYLTTASGSHFRGRPVEMLEMWSGHDNLLWRVNCRGQEAVVKLFLDAGQARGRRQFDGHERHSHLGIAPPPLWFDRYPTGLSRQILAYEWIPGAPLELTDERSRLALAKSVAQVHAGDPAEVRRFCPHPLNLDYFWRVLRGGLPGIQQSLTARAGDLDSLFMHLFQAAKRVVEQALPLWQQAAPTPVHGDLRPENGVYHAGGVVLLDWEMFGLGDPALDVANLLYFGQDALAGTNQQAWLDDYLNHFAQPGLAQRIEVYTRLLPFHSLCFLLNGLFEQVRRHNDEAAIGEALPFLAQTLAATFQASAATLQIELEGEAIDALVSRLLDDQLFGKGS